MAFHKKVVEFWQSNILPRQQNKNYVTIMAAKYASVPGQVQVVLDTSQGKEKGCNNKLHDLLDQLFKMMTSIAKGLAEDK